MRFSQLVPWKHESVGQVLLGHPLGKPSMGKNRVWENLAPSGKTDHEILTVVPWKHESIGRVFSGHHLGKPSDVRWTISTYEDSFVFIIHTRVVLYMYM